MKESHLDRDDAVSVDKLLNTDYKDCTIYYQAINRQERKPFIAVLQSPFMKKKMVNINVVKCVNDLLIIIQTRAVLVFRGFWL